MFRDGNAEPEVEAGRGDDGALDAYEDETLVLEAAATNADEEG